MAGNRSNPGPKTEGRKPAILIVDDQRTVREQLQRLCAPLCDSVELAADGEECLEFLRHQRPDLLLLDLFMPRRDGLSVLGELHRHPHLRPQMVVVMSGLDDEFVVRQILEKGADAFIHKPLENSVLGDILNRFSPHVQPQSP